MAASADQPALWRALWQELQQSVLVRALYPFISTLILLPGAGVDLCLKATPVLTKILQHLCYTCKVAQVNATPAAAPATSVSGTRDPAAVVDKLLLELQVDAAHLVNKCATFVMADLSCPLWYLLNQLNRTSRSQRLLLICVHLWAHVVTL